MPSIWNRLYSSTRSVPFGKFAQKSSKTGALVALHSQGRPVWTPRDYAALAREGFARNPVVYRCTRMIAEAAASLHWLAYEGERELDRHPLLELVARPNSHQAGPDLFESLFGYLL
ncbi:MAG: phage portal protein, partial [Rhizobiales bacterium]|nr:phage portal protein [Hyphomicrobiales bacterium]